MVNVADLEVGGRDDLGQTVTGLYARKPPFYAVYRASRRVMICYADASQQDKAPQQRRDLSPLAPIRGEIDGLIDGWRQGAGGARLGYSAQLRQKADRYDRRVADALVVALEGDVPSAAAILEAIKQEILNERTATARFEYLIAAFLAALGAMFAAWLVTTTYPLLAEAGTGRPKGVGIVLLLLGLVAAIGFTVMPLGARTSAEAGGGGAKPGPDPDAVTAMRRRAGLSALLLALLAIPVAAMLLTGLPVNLTKNQFAPGFDEAARLWSGACAGSVGAFFSIALGIRGRTVLPDLLRTSNLMDAALRVAIGFIAGGVLNALFKLGVVHVAIGATDLADGRILSLLVAGFLAGFSERLVPDLLEKANAQPGVGTAASAARIARTGPPSPAATDIGVAAGTRPEDPAPSDEEQVDGCACDLKIDATSATPDIDLPPASGGVAK